MTSRLMLARGGVPPRRRRHSMRNGQNSRDAIAATVVVKSTRNDESSAKPAPGPT